ncbi:tryptophan synthase, alpha chain [Candidatus Nitrososphaera evergladensis SR1]|jgi:tryptophan synthase alpha chain|uniref:Tryptophan synthase alpha chain n=1 Tax=Candidatus Nitrososphaera evergladensis SR1 TaxID=1459636 RepID=A0A075MQY9_9ARCH|nr:tryptophan synthase subunit alpha [Candidatus Nitrososphaera evergladensis]AIF83971.1 tryptophan synthase, alpha chain [Candidatus Nitrososphaera evergladensis SR1]
MQQESNKNRIDARFANLAENKECALVCYVVAGFPDFQTTAQIIDALVEGGADIIEIGIPFSDPIADGPTIQRASQAALERGSTPAKALQLAKQVRKKHPSLPLLVMTYSNLFVKPGWGDFIAKCKEAGIDGFILPDMPVEEASEYLPKAAHNGMATVFLASPNTPEERLKKIAQNSSGFMYLVSVYGITGARRTFENYTKDAVQRAKKAAGGKIPVGVGFGISKPEHARFMVNAGADAIIVGSALVDRISNAKNNRKAMLKELKAFSASLKKACYSSRA